MSAELESSEVEVEVDLITDTGWEEARGALGPAEDMEAALVVAVVEVEGLEFAAGARETAGVGEAAEAELEAAAAGEDGMEASSLARSAAARVSQPTSCPTLPAPDTSQHAACARDTTRPLGRTSNYYKYTI